MSQHSASGSTGKPYFDCVANPWTGKPAQLPDEFNGATMPAKFRLSYTLTADAAGSAAISFFPSLQGPLVKATSITAGAVTWGTGQAFLDWTSISATFVDYRIISTGLCIVYTGAESSAAGTMIIAPVTGATYADASVSNTITDWFNSQGAVSLSVPGSKNPLCMALANFDRPAFQALASDFRLTFPNAMIGVTGATASTTFRVDLYMNVELIAKPNNVIHQLQTPSPVNTAAIQDASRRLTSVRGGSNGVTALVSASLRAGGSRAPYRKKTTYKRRATYKRKAPLRRRPYVGGSNGTLMRPRTYYR